MADFDGHLDDILSGAPSASASLDIPAHLEFLDNPLVFADAPVATLISPVTGTLQEDGSVKILISEAEGGTLSISLVYASFANLGRPTEVIYAQDGFKTPYVGTAVSGSLTLTFYRLSGFPDDVTIVVLAVDELGTFAYYSFPLSVLSAGTTVFGASTGTVVPAGRDLALIGNEIDVSSGAAYLTTGADAVAQALRIALHMVLGEWFVNLDAGVDYFGQVFVKNPNLAVIKQIYRAKCLEIAGVLDVTDINLSVSSSRVLSGSITVSTDFGELTVPLEEVV